METMRIMPYILIIVIIILSIIAYSINKRASELEDEACQKLGYQKHYPGYGHVSFCEDRDGYYHTVVMLSDSLNSVDYKEINIMCNTTGGQR